MSIKNIPYSWLFVGLVLSLVASLGKTAEARQAGNNFTVHIDCGGQGIVDQKHEVEITVTGPNGDVTVKVDVPPLTDSEAVTGLIRTELKLKGVAGCGTAETTNEKFDEHQAHDVTLPADYKLKSATVYKKGQKDDGHLKVYDSAGKKVSNP
jgi:hypothetical protein